MTRIVKVHGQSNVAGRSLAPWDPPPNLSVWNGGFWSPEDDETATLIGNAFVAPDPTRGNVAMGYAAEIAREYPQEDVRLIITARGSTGIRAATGMVYTFNTSTSGDPGSGCIGFNSANTAMISTIRYSETDRENNPRFFGGHSLGASTRYPGRVEVVGWAEPCFIEFTGTAAAVDNGAFRTQTIDVTASENWPPQNGAQVRVFPMLPRMGAIMTQNINAAFAALGMTGAARKFDHVLLWPTEGDRDYPVALENSDFPRLMSRLEGFMDWATPVCMPLPWPYGGASSEVQRETWWATIRRIVAAQGPNWRAIPLDRSGAENWQDTNLVHVADGERTGMGKNIRIAERR